jgi:hypothetical protein
MAIPIKCGKWDCPDCRKEKAAKYRKRMSKLYDGRKLYYMTFTYYHDITPDKAWATYNTAWNRFRTYISKQVGKFNYVRVLESHKSSPYPHLHVICDIYVPAVVFAMAAKRAGFGYQLDCQAITTEGAMKYVTKYLTKEWQNEEGSRLRKMHNCRIVSFSRGLLDPLTRKGEWDVLLVGASLSQCVEAIRDSIEWNREKYPEQEDVKEFDDYYEVSVVFFDRPEIKDYSEKEDWSPEWYTGKGRGPTTPINRSLRE